MDIVPNTSKAGAGKKRHEEEIVEKTKHDHDEKQHFKNKHLKLKERADKQYDFSSINPENINSKSKLITPYIKEKKKLMKEEKLSADKIKESEKTQKKKEEMTLLREKVKKEKEEVKVWKEKKEAEDKVKEDALIAKQKEKEQKLKEQRLAEIEERKKRSEDAINTIPESKENYDKRIEMVQTRKEFVDTRKRDIVLTQKGELLPEVKEVKINGEK